MPKIVSGKGVKQEITTVVTPEESRGLKFALVAFVVFVAGLLALSIPEGAFFRAADGSLVPKSPLIDSIVAILFIFFVATGAAYGYGAGTVKKLADVPKYMGSGIKDSISFCVIAFPAAMFAQIGFSPSLTQCAYRVGDSITNCIAPINFFLPIVIGIMNKYKAPDDPEFGLGTLISYMLPYSIALGIVLIIQLVIWMLIGLPLGPGVALYL